MAKTIGICSGKGGVGKTFCAVNLSRFLSRQGKKVLLIDCDFNLGNCGFFLGLSSYKTLLDFLKTGKVNACVSRTESFDFVGAESGNLELIEEQGCITESLLKFIWATQKKYDFIILDFGAGIDDKLLSILAFCDHRFIVMNPEKLSLKDSYAMLKVLKVKYGVVDFSIVPNRVKSLDEWEKIKDILTDMNDRFLQVHLNFLRHIELSKTKLDLNARKSLVESIAVGEDFNKTFNFLVDKVSEEEIPFWIRPRKQDAFFERLRSN